MNRTKKFLYNSVFSIILQITTMLAGFIIPRIMLQMYGSEINGLVSSISQFIAYFNLVEAGLASAAIYALYEPLASNNYKEINGVICAAKKFYAQAGYIFISLTIGLAVIYPYYVKTEALSVINVGMLVLILGVNGALEFFTLAKYRVLLSADQKTYIISIASIVHIIINTVIIIIVAKLNTSIIVLRLVALLSIFIRSIILMLYCKFRYKYLNYKEKPDIRALNKRWDALYLQITGAVQVGAPVILATIFTDLKWVSIYTIFNMVIGGVNGILSVFLNNLTASFGDVIVKKEQEILKKAYSEFEYSFYIVIAITYSITMIMIMPFIKIYTEGIVDINYNLPFLGILFVINGLVYNLKTPQGMLIISAGMFKETRFMTTIQALIIIILGCILAPKFGLYGIIVASIISNLYRVIDMLFFVPKRITHLSVRITFYRQIRVIICFLVSNGIAYLINMNIYNYKGWFKYAIFSTIYTMMIVIIINTISDKKESINVIKRIKYLIKQA